MKEFTWTDALIKEFAHNNFITDADIEEFKKSKEKKKDYEILKYQYDSGAIFDIFGAMPLDAKIYSVKRLSDGEVFRLGDGVMWNLPEQSRNPFTINSFEIHNTLPLERMFCNNNNIAIEYLKKAEKRFPLFTTHDGEDIFEGDEYIAVQKNSFNILTGCRNILSNPDIWVTFSTLEKANEWILMNKPILSLNDLLSVWGEGDAYCKYYHTAPLFLKFKKLAEEKITQ